MLRKSNRTQLRNWVKAMAHRKSLANMFQEWATSIRTRQELLKRMEPKTPMTWNAAAIRLCIGDFKTRYKMVKARYGCLEPRQPRWSTLLMSSASGIQMLWQKESCTCRWRTELPQLLQSQPRMTKKAISTSLIRATNPFWERLVTLKI